MSQLYLTFYEFVKNALEDIKIEAFEIIRPIACESELDQLELSSLGLDSIDIFELIGHIESMYAVKIEDHDVYGLGKLGELKAILVNKGAFRNDK